MKVLAVGAHPDDLEILCGGTLARYAQEGHDVVMCHATKGDRGSFEYSAEEVSTIRHREAGAAAEVIGAEHISLGLSDAEVNASDPEQRLMMIDLVRATKPDVIITHSPNDYMGDHNEVSRLVFDTSFFASLPLIETAHAYHEVVPALFYMDTFTGLRFEPTEFVDISEVVETKVQMLSCHESQLRWIRDHDGVDIVGQLKITGAFRGHQSGVPFAEGFERCLAWLRGTTTRLLP